MSTSSIVVLLVIAAFVIYLIAIYNRLVSLKNQFQNAFAQIEVQLKRRYDLIPNLIETAKGYLKHERETLEAVVQARNSAQACLKAAASDPGNAGSIKALAGAESLLSEAIGKLNIVMEAYPDLRASENMQQLSEELTGTENRVSFSRQAFNDAVTGYNSYRQSFPQVIVAGLVGHGRDADLLEFADSAQIQAAPKVSF